MKKGVLITLLGILVITLIIGFIKYSTFFKIDKCLDSGGSWNYETGTCECQTVEHSNIKALALTGTKWYSIGHNSFSNDSMFFRSGDKVEYFLGELSYYFDSRYTIEKDTLTIETVLAAFELNDISGIKPDLLQKYLILGDTLKLIYLGNKRENKWIEASRERYSNINDFNRIQ